MQRVKSILATSWRFAWGPALLFLRLLEAAGALMDIRALADFWGGLPPSFQIVFSEAAGFALPFALGVWATLRYRDLQFSRPRDVLILEAIDHAYQRLPAHKRSQLEEGFGEWHVAEELRDMAGRGEIEIRGRAERGELRRPIPTEYWFSAQIDGASLTSGDNAIVHTESTHRSAPVGRYCDMTLSLGDARKLYERAKRDRNFGRNNPLAGIDELEG